MLFSRELKVKHVEQINHDTKRITVDLPGGKGEISGVPASCKWKKALFLQAHN
jgi:cytochrome-b5 reductase